MHVVWKVGRERRRGKRERDRETPGEKQARMDKKKKDDTERGRERESNDFIDGRVTYEFWTRVQTGCLSDENPPSFHVLPAVLDVAECRYEPPGVRWTNPFPLFSCR